ncbi:HU family DNA-binding protein [uncultured Roseovarius sp.]|uniref:HU family DNA-binding protein n=1 Tax=uncultured Roseovarius sp. TaxID=293344 RepID=UPI002638A27E|nr:HU family DNA-binding protein [uncultured Roseovarius sp.]
MTTKAKTTSPRKTSTKSTTRTSAAKPKTARKASVVKEPVPVVESAAVIAPVDNAADNVIALTVTDTIPADAGPELKKQELIDKVLGKGDIKKKYAKPVVEAVLEVLGEALAEGRELNLPPMGKIKINRVRDVANARIIVAKIRQPKAGSGSDAGTDDQDSDDDMKDEVAQGEE